MIRSQRISTLQTRAEEGTLSKRDLKTVETIVHQKKKQAPPADEGERLSLAFGEMVKRARLEKGWTPAMLAEAAGWHRSFVDQLEGGFKRNLQMKTMAQAAAALDLDLTIQLGED